MYFIILLLIVTLIAICIVYRLDKPFIVVYIKDFLDQHDYNIIEQQCKTYPLDDIDNDAAKNRLVHIIDNNDKCCDILWSEQYKNKIINLLEKQLKPAYDIPMEYRVYSKGSSMMWHVDTILYDKPQIECIYTIDNTSDSLTQYKDRYGVVHSIWTEPNSLLVVLAGDINHRVTTLNTGYRTIIKYAYEC
jgi:hypothetical protein